MTRFGFFLITLLLIGSISADKASAYQINDNHQAFGYGQVWMIYEEDATGGSEITDEDGVAASDTTFGFKAKRLRFGLRGVAMDGLAFYNLMLDAASGSASLVDYWVGLNLAGAGVAVQFGQFRPFVNYTSSLTKALALKNIERDEGLKNVASAFFVENFRWRDRGLQFTVGASEVADIVFSITNGSGVGGGAADVGGDLSGGGVYVNNMGDVAYVVGAVIKPVVGFRVTASYGVNRHNQMVISGADTAINVDRTVWSAGFLLDTGALGYWFDAEWSEFTSGEGDTEYRGAKEYAYFTRIGYYVAPKVLELVIRWGVDTDNGVNKGTIETESVTEQISVTGNLYLGTNFKAQVEYNLIEPDDNDAYESIIINFQASF